MVYLSVSDGMKMRKACFPSGCDCSPELLLREPKRTDVRAGDWGQTNN